MVKFIVLILTMPGVKLLVYVEIMNEDVCRLHLTPYIVFFIKLLVFESSPKYWSRGFQFEQFVNFTFSTQKMSVEQKKFLGAMIAIVIACRNFWGELEKERNFYGLTKGNLCWISSGFFCLWIFTNIFGVLRKPDFIETLG